MITRFVFEHKDCRVGGLRWGVEPICKVLSDQLGCQIAPSTYYEHLHTRPVRRERADEELKPQVRKVHADNDGVYGARKVWLTLCRQGVPVARCTVERLMRQLGLVGGPARQRPGGIRLRYGIRSVSEGRDPSTTDPNTTDPKDQT